jgi:hypothetical protein
MGEIVIGNWDLRKRCLRLNVPSPILQVRIPIRGVITLIRGHPHRIGLVIPLITYNLSYSPRHSHLPPPSLSSSSTTLLSSQNTLSSYPSLSRHVMIMGWHQVEHTPSTAYTEYKIHSRCLSSLPPDDYELTPESSFSFRYASPRELKG